MRRTQTTGILLALTLLASACASSTAEDPVDAEATAKAPAIITSEIYPEPAKQPNFGPKYGSLSFTDTDPGPTIGGVLTMGRATGSDGEVLDEAAEGITMYMVHWGLEVGAPGIADDKGAGDLGGDCRGFRDTGHVVMKPVAEVGPSDTLSWTIPDGTEVPENAVYFVGHTLYGEVHNLGKCTQVPIDNLIK